MVKLTQLDLSSYVTTESSFYQNPMLHNAFLLVSATSRGSIYIYMFSGPTQLSIPNCISVSSAIFAQLTAESLYFAMCVKGHMRRFFTKLMKT